MTLIFLIVICALAVAICPLAYISYREERIDRQWHSRVEFIGDCRGPIIQEKLTMEGSPQRSNPLYDL